MQARFYLPMWGRFASPDPARDQHFEDTQSWNIYSYCMNNPVMLVDANGMWPEWFQKVSSLAAYGKWQTFDQNAKNVVYSQTPIGPDGRRQIDQTWGLNVNGEYIKQYDHRAIQDDSGSLLVLAAGANLAKNLAQAGIGMLARQAEAVMADLAPSSIRLSQSSVNGTAEIAASMSKSGWVGAPVDVVKMADGGLTTLDNTRVVAASRAGIDVKAAVHGASDAISPEMGARFASKAGAPAKTWGEAVQNRIQNQAAKFRTKYPNGSPVTSSKD